MPPAHAFTGSSPRVRGTPPAGFLRARRGRFIPARAGNALAPWRTLRGPPVHPRACGERLPREIGRSCQCGSSPRVRGTLRAAGSRHHRDRFIPARAGNACRQPRPPSWWTVHPRACGERHDGTPNSQPIPGSSPRVRGTPRADPPPSARQRFIPARAGNAVPRAASRRCRPVHPRACGERGGAQSERRQAIGSSPRVRGTRELIRVVGVNHRFIPARAGNALD